jgi:hypothetical protein
LNLESWVLEITGIQSPNVRRSPDPQLSSFLSPVASVFPAIPPVFPAIAQVFDPIAAVFGTVAAIFQPVAKSAIMHPVASIFAKILAVLTAIAQVFAPIAAIFQTVATVLESIANRSRALRAGERVSGHGREQRKREYAGSSRSPSHMWLLTGAPHLLTGTRTLRINPRPS